MAVNEYMTPAEYTPGVSYVSQYIPLPFEDMMKQVEKKQAKQDAIVKNLKDNSLIEGEVGNFTLSTNEIVENKFANELDKIKNDTNELVKNSAQIDWTREPEKYNQILNQIAANKTKANEYVKDYKTYQDKQKVVAERGKKGAYQGQQLAFDKEIRDYEKYMSGQGEKPVGFSSPEYVVGDYFDTYGKLDETINKIPQNLIASETIGLKAIGGIPGFLSQTQEQKERTAPQITSKLDSFFNTNASVIEGEAKDLFYKENGTPYVDEYWDQEIVDKNGKGTGQTYGEAYTKKVKDDYTQQALSFVSKDVKQGKSFSVLDDNSLQLGGYKALTNNIGKVIDTSLMTVPPAIIPRNNNDALINIDNISKELNNLKANQGFIPKDKQAEVNKRIEYLESQKEYMLDMTRSVYKEAINSEEVTSNYEALPEDLKKALPYDKYKDYLVESLARNEDPIAFIANAEFAVADWLKNNAGRTKEIEDIKTRTNKVGASIASGKVDEIYENLDKSYSPQSYILPQKDIKSKTGYSYQNINNNLDKGNFEVIDEATGLPIADKKFVTNALSTVKGLKPEERVISIETGMGITTFNITLPDNTTYRLKYAGPEEQQFIDGLADNIEDDATDNNRTINRSNLDTDRKAALEFAYKLKHRNTLKELQTIKPGISKSMTDVDGNKIKVKKENKKGMTYYTIYDEKTGNQIRNEKGETRSFTAVEISKALHTF